jgi:hypothetical protein
VKQNDQGSMTHPINGQHYFARSRAFASGTVVPPSRAAHAVLKCAKRGTVGSGCCLVKEEPKILLSLGRRSLRSQARRDGVSVGTKRSHVPLLLETKCPKTQLYALGFIPKSAKF